LNDAKERTAYSRQAATQGREPPDAATTEENQAVEYTTLPLAA